MPIDPQTGIFIYDETSEAETFSALLNLAQNATRDVFLLVKDLYTSAQSQTVLDRLTTVESSVIRADPVAAPAGSVILQSVSIPSTSVAANSATPDIPILLPVPLSASPLAVFPYTNYWRLVASMVSTNALSVTLRMFNVTGVAGSGGGRVVVIGAKA